MASIDINFKKLLGFRLLDKADADAIRLGAKTGVKSGVKLGEKLGTKTGTKRAPSLP